MASATKSCRVLSQVVGVLFQLISIALVLTALLTAAWQVVYIEQTKVLYQHGLWLDCVEVGKSSLVHTADSSGWTCTYKFSQNSGKQPSEPVPKTWLIVLALLSGGGFISVVGLFFSYCICCPRVSSILWVITNAFTAFASAAGIIVFFRSSQEPQNRIYIVFTTSYVQQLGYSFWLAVAACGLQIVCLFCSIIYAILVYIGLTHSSNINVGPKVQMTHNTIV